MTDSAFPVDVVRTAIAIAYKNPAYIAEEVLPYDDTIGASAFKYQEYPKGQGFNLPDTKVGRVSQPNQLVLEGSEKEAVTEDHAIDIPTAQGDIERAPKNVDLLGRATERATDVVLIGHEKRTADLVFASGTYPAANKIALAGADQWDDPASDPIGVILAALDACLIRPNIMAIGGAAWTKLQTHTKMVKAVNGNSGDSGIARRKQIAELFELEDVFVGQSRLNTAKPGQAPVLSGIWGPHCALLHRNKTADTTGGLTFGFTARFGGRLARTFFDEKIGMKGGTWTRSGESVRELVVAPDAGYLIQNAV